MTLGLNIHSRSDKDCAVTVRELLFRAQKVYLYVTYETSPYPAGSKREKTIRLALANKSRTLLRYSISL